MKTVIARFTEMKKAASDVIDVDGETIDVNKVDTALKSVGVSLKDTKGQFRDLDDVFLELSAKWNSLDKMSQRYVATMAAGSRQQSRFIAMMQNYSRTVELVDAANDSSGASNEQFEKTLDSLEAKINTLKDVWQEFILGLTNSSVIKFGVDVLTKLVEVLNKATTSSTSLLTSLLKWGTIITAFSTVRNFLQGYLGGIIKLFTEKFGQAGREAGKALKENLEKSSKVDSVADNAAKATKKKLIGPISRKGQAQESISKIYDGVKKNSGTVDVFELLKVKTSFSKETKKIGDIVGGSKDYKLIQGSVEQMAEQAIQSAATANGGFTQAGETWAQKLLEGFKERMATGEVTIKQNFETLKSEMEAEGTSKNYKNGTGKLENFTINEDPTTWINEEKTTKAQKRLNALSIGLSTAGLAANALDQQLGSSSIGLAGLSTALTTAGSAMMTLTTLTELLSIELSAGPQIAIVAVIAAIAAVIAAIKRYKEVTEEARQATIEDAKATKEEADSLRENYKEYNNLLQTYKKSGEGKEELADKTKELVEQYKDEIDGLENLGDNYEGVAKKISKYLKEKNKQSHLKTGAAVAAADASIEDDSKVMGTYAGSGYDTSNSWHISAKLKGIKDQDLEAIQKELNAYITDQGYSITLSDVGKTGNFWIQNIDTAADKVAAYNTALKLRNELEEKGYTETAYYKELVDWIGNATAGIESLDEALQEKIISGVQSVTLDFEGLDQIDDFEEYLKNYNDIYDKVKALNDKEEWGLSDEQIRKQVRAQLEGYENLADFVQQQDFEIEIKTKFGEDNSDVDDWLNKLREDGDLSLLVGVDIEDVDTFEELQSIINQKKIDIKLNIGTSISNAAANVIDAIMAQTKDKKLSKEQTEELQEFNAALSKTPGLFDESKTAYEEFYDIASQGTIRQLSYLGKWVSEAAEFEDEYNNAYLAAGMSSQFTIKTQEAQDLYEKYTAVWQKVIEDGGKNAALGPALEVSISAETWEPGMTAEDAGIDTTPFVNAAEERLEYFDHLYSLSIDRRKELLESYDTALADYEGLTQDTFDHVKLLFDENGLLQHLKDDSEDAIYVLTDQIQENLKEEKIDAISLGVEFKYNSAKTVEENYEDLIASIEKRKVEIKEGDPPLSDQIKNDKVEILDALDELEKEELKIKAEIEIKGIESTQKQLEVLDGHLDSIKSLMDKIGEGFEIDYGSLDEVMNLAPELLRDATVTSEGIIKLNEKTVKNFIDGQLEEEKAHHKTIIDQKKEELKKAQENTKQIRAEIDRVEAQKTAEVEISSEKAAEMLSIETFLQQERLSEDEKTEQGVAEASQKAAQAQIDNSKAVAAALDAVNQDLSTIATNYQALAEGDYGNVTATDIANGDGFKGKTTGSEAVTSNGEKQTLSEIYKNAKGTITLKEEDGSKKAYLDALKEMEKMSLEDEKNIQASIDDWDNYLKLEEAALAGMKKTLGQSKDKSSSEKDPFENDRSEADNLQNQIEKEQKIRNQLEEEYNDLQDEENKNYDAILENLQKQNESLEREKELAQQIKDIRNEDVQDYLNRHPELSKYATYEDGVLTYNIEALDALNGDTTGKGEEIDKKLDELEKLIKEKDTAEEKYDEIIKKEKDIVDKEEEVRKEIKEKAEEEAKKAADRTVQLMDFIGDTINTAFEFLKLSLDKLYNINSALKAIERRANRLGTEYEKMLRDRPGDGDEIDVNTRIENATMRVSSAMEKYLTANEKKNQAENELARYNLQSAFSPGSLSYDFGAGRIRKDPVKALVGDVFGVSLNWLSTFANFSGEIAKYTDEKTNTNAGEVASTVATGIASLATSAYDSFKDYGSDIDQQIESLSQELDNAYDEMLEALDELYELQSIGLEQYLDLEQEVYDALQDSIQQEIDELEKFNDNITEADQDLTDSLRDMVDSIRQTRENEKTEKDLADKERRLAYLRQDTSGANLQEILKLEKELEESQQSYTDSLIDQKIDELEKQNELAAEQRQLQIEILQAQKEDAAVQWATVTEILNRMVTQNADGTFTEHPEEVLSMLRNTDTYKNASPVKQQEMDKGFYQLINGGMDYVAFQKNGGISSILTEVSLDYSQDLLDSINTLLGSGYKITNNGITSAVAGFTDILDLAGLKDVAEKAAEAANKAGQSELAKKFESLIARINASGKALDEKLNGEQLSAIISDFIDLDTGLPKGFKNSSMKVNDEQYAGIINAQTIQTGILSDFKKAAEDFFSVAVVGLGAGGSIATAFGGLALALPGIISAALPFLSALTKGDLAGMIGSFMGIDTSGAGAGGLAALGGGSLLGIIAGLIGLFTDFAGKDYQGASNGLMSILENVMNFVTGIGKILGGGSSGGSSGGTGDVFLKLLSGFADFIRSASPVLGDLLNSIGLLIALPGIFKSMESGGVATGGLTLVGENGVELIQGNGYAYLAGTNGPEFTNLNKGDYVYNNKDTRRVLRNGRLMPRYENGAIPFSNPLKAYAYKIPNYSNGINNNSQSSRELTSNVHLNMDGVLIDSPERVDEIANRVFEKIRDWTWPDNGWLNR